MNTQDLHQCRNEGRLAFQHNGVNGVSSHSYPVHSIQRQAFVDGHDQARMDAAERAQSDAATYHALSVRDNAKDRIWATKLAHA